MQEVQEAKFFAKVAEGAIDSEHVSDRMNSSNVVLLQFSEEDMNRTRRDAAVCQTNSNFNYNKLQAVACILTSSMVSIALIYWAVRSFF